MLASALATLMVGAAQARVSLLDDVSPSSAAPAVNNLLAQDGGGDSAGRGPDTSKGAVPKDPPSYPTGVDSPGTSPVPPSPENPAGKPGTPPATLGKPATPPDTPTGTGTGSPGTTQQGGSKRTDQ